MRNLKYAAQYAYQDKHRAKYNEYSRAYRERRYHSDPEWANRVKRQSRFSKYKLTEEGYKELWGLSGGMCGICGQHGLALEIDHDHHTKRIRGLLCGPCNRILGMMERRPTWISRAESYLERSLT